MVKRVAFAVGAVCAAFIIGCEGCDPDNPAGNGSPQALVVYTSVDEVTLASPNPLIRLLQ